MKLSTFHHIQWASNVFAPIYSFHRSIFAYRGQVLCLITKMYVICIVTSKLPMHQSDILNVGTNAHYITASIVVSKLFTYRVCYMTTYLYMNGYLYIDKSSYFKTEQFFHSHHPWVFVFHHL